MNFVPWGFTLVELMRSESPSSGLCALLPVNWSKLKRQAEEGRCISLCPSGMLFTDLSCFGWRKPLLRRQLGFTMFGDEELFHFRPRKG